MTAWEVWVETCRLMYRLRRKRIDGLVRQSLAEIERAKGQFARAYVSFSGGKDSVLMLHLTRLAGLALPCQWCDEWDTADTWKMLDWVEATYGQPVYRVRAKHHPEYFRRYGRDPVLNQPIRIDAHIEQYRDYGVSVYGWDACFVGMRRDESKHRDLALRHGMSRRLKGQGEMLRVAPLANWTLEDVWAYTVGEGLPIHEGYRKQLDCGVDPRHARIGALTIVRVLQFGVYEVQRAIYPDEFNAMLAVNPWMRDV